MESSVAVPVTIDHQELLKMRSRILAIREQGSEPLIRADPAGSISPSPSLLVERFDLGRSDWEAHLLTDQIVTLFLKPTTIGHVSESGVVSEFQIASGQVVICNRNHRESLCWKDPASILCVRVGDAALNESARALAVRGRVTVLPKPEAGDPRLTNLLYALEAERASGYPSGRLLLDNIEATLASILVTSHSGLTPQQTPSKGGLPPQCLRRVMEYMYTNIDRQVALKDLAALAGLSQSHFSRQFCETTRLSPCRYMLALRIERSKELLKNPDISILEVALSVGFENQQHFSTVFRRLVGVSPSSYRRHL